MPYETESEIIKRFLTQMAGYESYQRWKYTAAEREVVKKFLSRLAGYETIS